MRWKNGRIFGFCLGMFELNAFSLCLGWISLAVNHDSGANIPAPWNDNWRIMRCLLSQQDFCYFEHARAHTHTLIEWRTSWKTGTFSSSFFVLNGESHEFNTMRQSCSFIEWIHFYECQNQLNGCKLFCFLLFKLNWG